MSWIEDVEEQLSPLGITAATGAVVEEEQRGCKKCACLICSDSSDQNGQCNAEAHLCIGVSEKIQQDGVEHARHTVVGFEEVGDGREENRQQDGAKPTLPLPLHLLSFLNSENGH